MGQQNMSKQYIAVGAQWCGYSTKQKDESDKLQGADNVHMFMCQGDGTDWEEGSWQKKTCDAAMGQIQGFPTWFEKEGDIEGDGEVKAIVEEKTVQQGLHFMPQDRLCEALPGACK